MKILHIIGTADPKGGGPIEGILRMSVPLKAAGHRQDLLTLDDPAAPFLADFPLPVHALGGASRGSRLIHGARAFPRALRWALRHEREYDAVVVDGLWNFATAVARWSLVGRRVPYIVYTHGMLDPWFRHRYPIKHVAKQVLWFVNEGVLLRRAAAVAFTCEEERRRARRSFWPYAARERVVRFGTDEPDPATAAGNEAFAAAVPMLKARPYILFLSRIHEKKGCDLLVAAFASVAQRYPDVDIVIAGPDQVGLKNLLIATAVEAGIEHRLHWPGMLAGDVKWAAFRGCDAFILPSHQENFGIVVAEALACGKPVLISNKVNIWREIADAGAGLVAEDSVAGTRELIEGFLAMPPDEQMAMGARARACFVERFHVKEAAEDLANMLNGAIRTRSGSRACLFFSAATKWSRAMGQRRG